MASKSKGAVSPFIKRSLWAFVIVLVLLFLAAWYAVTYLGISADTTATKFDSFYTVAAGQTKTLDGVGSVQIDCANNNTTPLTNFVVNGTVATRGYINSAAGTGSPRTANVIGKAISTTGSSQNFSVAPGKSGVAYPGPVNNVTLSSVTRYCRILLSGVGTINVSAVGGPITLSVIKATSNQTTTGIVEYTINVSQKDTCSATTVKAVGGGGKGATTNSTSTDPGTGFSIGAHSETYKVSSRLTYPITFTDSATGKSTLFTPIDGKGTTINVVRACSGSLTPVQIPSAT